MPRPPRSPAGAWLLATAPYLVLLGADPVHRASPAWPFASPPRGTSGAGRPSSGRGPEVLAGPRCTPLNARGRPALDALQRVRAQAGYRVTEHRVRGGLAVAGTRRGWSRLVGQLSHLALVLMLLGAAAGHAFSSETTFSLLPGDQALLDAPRSGFTDAVRLDRFDSAFGADGRPPRLDATVTFLRDGRAGRDPARSGESARRLRRLPRPWLDLRPCGRAARRHPRRPAAARRPGAARRRDRRAAVGVRRASDGGADAGPDADRRRCQPARRHGVRRQRGVDTARLRPAARRPARFGDRAAQSASTPT